MIALAIFALGALAQTPATQHWGSVTAQASASVTILAPSTIGEKQALTLGDLRRPSNGNTNTVSLDGDDKVVISGKGNAAPRSGQVSSGKFFIAGSPGTAYSTTQSLSFAEPGLANVVPRPAAAGPQGLIPSSGVQELRVGASFEITAATPAQTYFGVLRVTTSYN